MQVLHRLAPVGTGVDHGPVSTFREAMLTRDLPCDEQERAEQVGVALARLFQGGDVLPGHDEHVHGRLWADVAESHQPLVRMDEVGRYGARGDLAEEA